MTIQAVENFKALSRPKKIAAVAGAVATAAVIGTTIAAGIKGKKAFNGEDTFKLTLKNGSEKELKKGITGYLRLGFKEIGTSISNLASKIFAKKDKAAAGGEKMGEAVEGAAENAPKMEEAVEEALTGVVE